LAAQGKRAVQNPPADLAAVIAAWPDLPEPIRAGIVAMVNATNDPARPSGANGKV